MEDLKKMPLSKKRVVCFALYKYKKEIFSELHKSLMILLD